MIGIEMHTKCTNEVLATITHFFRKFAWCYIDTYEIISYNEQIDIGDIVPVSVIQSIAEKEENCFINARMFLYDRRKDAAPIEESKNFDSSDCVCVILIVDADFIEIYFKDSHQSETCRKQICKVVPNVIVTPIEYKRTSFAIF